MSLFSHHSTDAVLDRLSKVPNFAFGPVGVAGLPSQGELDYKQVLARPSALKDFEKLFQSTAIEAKCYALTGLFKLNHDEFLKLAQPFRTGDAKASVMSGCIMRHEAVASILSEIESGIYA